MCLNAKKIALFVEGRSELIFIRKLLLIISNYSFISIKCVKLLSDNNFGSNVYSYDMPCPCPKVEVLLVEVGGDQKVISVIKNRAEGLLRQKYSKIWGVRDMYSGEYHKKSGGRINNTITTEFITSANKVIASCGLSGKAKIFFSVMELEAWFLGFHRALGKIGFPLAKIRQVITKDITKIDPETEFFRPKSVLSLLCKKIWNKNYNEAQFSYKIISRINVGEVKSLVNSKKISHFRDFYKEASIEIVS